MIKIFRLFRGKDSSSLPLGEGEHSALELLSPTALHESRLQTLGLISTLSLELQEKIHQFGNVSTSIETEGFFEGVRACETILSLCLSMGERWGGFCTEADILNQLGGKYYLSLRRIQDLLIHAIQREDREDCLHVLQHRLVLCLHDLDRENANFRIHLLTTPP